jgi:3-deoxy-D-manno-octulosonic-acid transferase
MGHLPAARQPLLWFHGASAGELSAAAQLVALLRGSGYRFAAGYTATNRAGVELAERVAAGDDVVSLAPWDTPCWVSRALDCWQPRALFLVETELWPGLIGESWRRGLPVFAVSARVYPRDAPRYRALSPLLRPTLARVTAALAQSEAERRRLVDIGFAATRCMVAGNLKYLVPATGAPAAAPLARTLGGREEGPLVVCGSIHGDEMSTLLAALARVGRADLRIIIAPRHASDATAAHRAAGRYGWPLWRRSCGPPPPDWRLLLLDTVGELRAAYAMASVAVVGGGFEMHGGHNLFEPVLAGAPVIFGPHVGHFADEARALTGATADACVAGSAALAARLRQWLGDDAVRRDVLARQRRVVPDGATIARQYLAALSPWLQRMGLPA